MEFSAQIPELMFRACLRFERHDNRKSWISRVARTLSWKHRRVKALFYCEARVVTADEWRIPNQRLDALKAAETATRNKPMNCARLTELARRPRCGWRKCCRAGPRSPESDSDA